MDRKQNEKYIRMTTAPVKGLIVRLAIPTMISMLVTTLYNLVDTYFVGQLADTRATAAVTVSYALMNIIQAVGFFFGQGSGNYISRALGNKEAEKCRKMAATGFLGALLSGTLILVFGMIFAEPLALLCGSEKDAQSLGYATDYMRVILIGAPAMCSSLVLNNQLRFQGNATFAMVGLSSGAVINVLLDALLVPRYKVFGAAIATVIGQAFGALAGFLFHHKHNKEVNIRLSDCRPDGHIILDIYRIGFPSILMVGIGSLTNYLMNRILMAFTSTAVALYGAYFKLQSFFFMPVFGLNNGIVPIVGYNYGARKKERIYRTIRYGVLYAVCILAVGLLLFEAIPGVLLQAFSPSEHMLAIGIPALRKIAIHFPIAAFCIVGGSVCQALGKSLYSFFTSVLRQVVALIPAAYLLSLTGNVGNVWWCFPIAEVVSACATAFFLRRALRNMDRELTLAEGQ